VPDEVENIEDIDRVKKKNLKKNWQKRNLGFFQVSENGITEDRLANLRTTKRIHFMQEQKGKTKSLINC